MTDAPPTLHPALAGLPRPAARADLLGVLDALGIAHATVDHPAVFTVEDGAAIKAAMPGGHTKNLFLKNKAGGLVLVSALGETRVPVNRLHKALAARPGGAPGAEGESGGGSGAQRFSFGKEEALWEALGVRPGSVTAFALVNDPERRVRMVLDAALLACDPVNFHPLENTATTAIAAADLLTFVRATGREPDVIDFAALAAETDGTAS